MATFTYLTDNEARGLTRHELLDRVEAQQAYYDAKRSKTSADEAAMDELSQIIHRYLNINTALDATFATLAGRPTSYWETRPQDDRPADPPTGDDAAGPGSGWPSSSASPQEKTAAVLARLSPQRLARMTAEADVTDQTAGQALAAALRQIFRIGTRTGRYGKLYGRRADLHKEMIEAIENAAQTDGYYSAEKTAALRTASGAARTYRKHVGGYRIDGMLAKHINGLSAYQFAALLGRMVDAGVTTVGDGELFLDAMTREIRI